MALSNTAASRIPGTAGAAALLCLGLASCVSLPGPAGPVMMEGPVPANEEAAAAAPVPGATVGPLLLRDVVLRHGSDHHTWAATLENPSDTTLLATVVVSLLDADGVPLQVDERSVEIGGGESRTLDGRVDRNPGAARFRVEYWVRVPTPPDRRIDRIGP